MAYVSPIEQGKAIILARKQALRRCAQALVAGDAPGAELEAALFGAVYRRVTGADVPPGAIERLIERASVLAHFTRQEQGNVLS